MGSLLGTAQISKNWFLFCVVKKILKLHMLVVWCIQEMLESLHTPTKTSACRCCKDDWQDAEGTAWYSSAWEEINLTLCIAVAQSRELSCTSAVLTHLQSRAAPLGLRRTSRVEPHLWGYVAPLESTTAPLQYTHTSGVTSHLPSTSAPLGLSRTLRIHPHLWG